MALFVFFFYSLFYVFFFFFFFFFNDTATTEIYTLSLHDALPNCATSWSLICCFDLHASICCWMNARSRLADGASSATASGTPHWRHITSSSMSGSDVLGHAAAAAAPGAAAARTSTSASDAASSLTCA